MVFGTEKLFALTFLKSLPSVRPVHSSNFMFMANTSLVSYIPKKEESAHEHSAQGWDREVARGT
ncbi:hypothetical protein L3Q82_008417, partial [Scortum barcoo]